MASLALAFDILARDKASATFDKVGDAADKTGRRVGKAGDDGGRKLGSGISSGVKLAAGALAGLGLAKVFTGFVKDAAESAKIGRLTDAVIKSTGGSANLTAQQVGSLATAISNKTAVDDEAIQSGANLLLTFTKVRNETGKGNDIFNQATQAAVDMSVALGTDVSGASLQLGKALNDPIKGVGALSRAGVSFTAQQKDQIKAMVEAGDTLGAQKIILGEMQTQFGGAAAAAASPLERLKVVAGNLGESVGGLLLPVIERLAGFVSDRLVPVVTQAIDILFKGDFTGGPFSEDSGVVDALFRIREGFLTVKDIARQAFDILFRGDFTGGPLAEDSGVVDALFNLRDAFFTLKDFVAGQVLPTLQSAGGFLRDNAAAFAVLGAAILSGVVLYKAYTAGVLIHTAATAGIAAATKAWTAVQAVLNGTLALNPIGLVVVAIVALVAAFVVAYKTSDTFRAIVQAAWVGIQGAVSFAWNNVIKPAFAALSSFVTDTLVPVLLGLWRNVIVPAFAGIQAAISFAWNNVIRPVFSALRDFVTGVLIPTITFLWRNVVAPAFDVMGFIIKGWWAVAQVVFAAAVGYVRNVLAPIFTWLWQNVVRPAFDGIAAVVKTVWERGIRPIFEALGGFIRDNVAPAFRAGVDAIGRAWEGIRAIAAVPVNFVIDTVYNNGIRAGFEAVAKAVGSDARLPRMSTVATRAKGGFTLPGFTLVGEEGPELVDFRTPGRVYTAEQTAAMREPGTGGPIDAVKSVVRKGTDLIEGAAAMLTDPLKWVRDKVAGLVSNIPGAGTLGGIAKAIPGKIVDAIKGKLSSMFGGGEEGGGIGGGSGPGGWQWQMATLRQVFPGLPLNSGFRPGAITATGNPSMHGKGRAVDVPPRMDVFNWIRQAFGATTKELIFSPAGGRQIHNGQPHVYSGVTKSMHYDHVHWGYDDGGVAVGRGLMPKYTPLPERVLSPRQTVAFERLVDFAVGDAVVTAVLAAEDRELLRSVVALADRPVQVTADGRAILSTVRAAADREGR